MLSNANKPILGFAAWSGCGKTTLIEKLIPLLSSRGLRVGLIKHSHHGFDIDTPGKDSYRLRKAGAVQTLVASDKRLALMVEHKDAETPEKGDPSLNDVLGWLHQEELDLILVEGFRHEPLLPKIELHRTLLNKPLLFPHDSSVIAIASDAPLNNLQGLHSLDINDHLTICDFILTRIDKI